MKQVFAPRIGLLLVLASALPVVTAAAAKLEPGARGYVVTALEGSTLEEIPVTYLGTYEDFAGPGYDVHLVKLEGPVAERIGVVAGMSGSPVYFDGRVIGALSYRLGVLPKDAVAGVTPLEDMMASARVGAAAPSGTMAGAVPIAAPLVASGLTPAARQWLGARLESHALVLAAGGSAADDGKQTPLVPGSPVGVQLVRGDMRIAATGTVTWVEGDRIWAFGHPFLGTGRVELPMVTAQVVHTLADLAGSVKLTNVGGEIGAFVEDRRAALVGRTSARASMLPFALELSGGDYGAASFHFEIVRNSELAPLMAAVVVLNTLQAAPGYDPNSTLRLTGHVDLGPRGALPIEMAFAGSEGDPSAAVASQVFAVLSSLWSNPFAELDVASIALEVVGTADVVSYKLERVVFDRNELRGGDTLEIRCSLRRFQGGVVTRTLELTLPTLLSDSEELMLAVGNPLTLDRALGSRLLRRLQSAEDITAYLDVLADIRSAHRLTAVVYDRGGSVLARGRDFERLPPTVERLLSTQAPPAARSGASISTLATAEQELDGPVVGLETVRLRIDHRRREPEDKP